MGFFKVILWIFLIILALMVLTGLLILTLLLIRARVGVDYDEDNGVKLRFGYGFLNFSPGGKEKKEKKPKKKHQSTDFLKKKAKEKGREMVQVKKFEKEIEKEEELQLKKEHLDSESARLDAEMAKAEEDEKRAKEAAASGHPLPDIVDKAEVSKLRQIRDKVDSWDIEGAINLARSFMEGFSFRSILSLLQFIKDESVDSLKKTMKRFTIKQAEVKLYVHGKDAAATALKYGTVASVVFPAMSLLVSNTNVRNYDVELVPWFLGTKDQAELHCTISFTPLRIMHPFVKSSLKSGLRTLKTLDKGMTKAGEVHDKLQKETKDILLDQTAEQLGY